MAAGITPDRWQKKIASLCKIIYIFFLRRSGSFFLLMLFCELVNRQKINTATKEKPQAYRRYHVFGISVCGRTKSHPTVENLYFSFLIGRLHSPKTRWSGAVRSAFPKTALHDTDALVAENYKIRRGLKQGIKPAHGRHQ